MEILRKLDSIEMHYIQFVSVIHQLLTFAVVDSGCCKMIKEPIIIVEVKVNGWRNGLLYGG
jgi:hypothetical protein